ncbi:MAG: TMEM165/GDT1 family protein [Sphingomonadaceae bacterium]
MLDAFAVSAVTVFVAEFGDKSQILAMVLAARFRRPWLVIGGMAAGLLLNHGLAAAAGLLVAQMLPESVLRWLIAGGFLAAALWMLKPDRTDRADVEVMPSAGRWGPFLTTLITFFLIEMGDKTQLMVIALAARFEAPVAVVAGTLTGILAALVPAVLLADRLLARVPVRIIRLVSAAVFAAVGVGALLA